MINTAHPFAEDVGQARLMSVHLRFEKPSGTIQFRKSSHSESLAFKNDIYFS